MQGALTSSYLASLCLFESEGDLVKKLERKNLVYTRFVDDITISTRATNYDFGYALQLVKDMLINNELPINENKTKVSYSSTESLTVHGLRISFKEPRLPSEEIRRIRAAVKNLELLAIEGRYRHSHSYRHDYNRCMGRVNKLKRINHIKFESLLARLSRIDPLPSPRDRVRVKKIIERLIADNISKKDTYWYWKRFNLAHQRLNILKKSYPYLAKRLRVKLKLIAPTYD
ncbi:reverse transcriptase domain-containing protein [Yersinia enterocolitica]